MDELELDDELEADGEQLIEDEEESLRNTTEEIEEMLGDEEASESASALDSARAKIEEANQSRLITTLNEVAKLKSSKDLTKEILELNSRIDTELSNDLIICGKCHSDFRLSDIVLFIEHKVNKCAAAGKPVSGDMYKCLSCSKLFKSAHYLLEHYEAAHQGQRSSFVSPVGRKPRVGKNQHDIISDSQNATNSSFKLNASNVTNNKKVLDYYLKLNAAFWANCIIFIRI